MLYGEAKANAHTHVYTHTCMHMHTRVHTSVHRLLHTHVYTCRHTCAAFTRSSGRLGRALLGLPKRLRRGWAVGDSSSPRAPGKLTNGP